MLHFLSSFFLKKKNLKIILYYMKMCFCQTLAAGVITSPQMPHLCKASLLLKGFHQTLSQK